MSGTASLSKPVPLTTMIFSFVTLLLNDVSTIEFDFGFVLHWTRSNVSHHMTFAEPNQAPTSPSSQLSSCAGAGDLST
jgi:hypothetical protein